MTDRITIAVRRLHADRDSDIQLPTYMSDDAAGMDICAAVGNGIELAPGQIELIPTGFAMALPVGYEAQIRPRSGLAVKHGVTVVNAPGTIDADYRGEVKVGLINLSSRPYTVRRGDRIAQMVVQRVARATVQQVESLEETHRDAGGFGSTGT